MGFGFWIAEVNLQMTVEDALAKKHKTYKVTVYYLISYAFKL